MGCPIYDCVDYLHLSTTVNRQREQLLLGPILGEQHRSRWEKVKYTPHTDSASLKPPSQLHEQLHKLLDRTTKMNTSWPFREPVQGVPGYAEVIKEPIDLKTMMEKNQRLTYKNKAELQNDLELMLKNAVTFNGENHEISKLAREVLDFVLPKLQAIVEYHVNGITVINA
jgi:hypothetical protein